MKKLHFLFTLLCCLITIVISAQVPFTSGNIVVTRIGNGVDALSSSASPVFLDEYSPSGNLVQSIAMPITGLGGSDTSKMFVLSPQEYNMGSVLTLSPNGRYLCMMGINRTVGTTFSGLLNSPSSERVIARIDYNAKINTTTGLLYDDAPAYPVSAITVDGTGFWSTNSSTGIRYHTLGLSTSVAITTASRRALHIFNNQLYSSSSASTIGALSGGLPTSGPQTNPALPGFTSDFSGNVLQMFFADLDPGVPGADVIYITHDGDKAFQKFSLVGGTWTSNGIIGDGTDDYCGITGVVNGTTVTLYATRKIGVAGASGGELVTLTDNTGYNGAFAGTPTVLVPNITGTNKAFRGVAMAPVAPSVKVAAKTFLQGAYSTSTGQHKDVTSTWAAVLNANATSQPYNTAAFGNYAGTESVSNTFFTSNTANDVVDWVLVELRDKNNPANLISRKAGFIREDGTIVGTDGVDLTINAPDESYYIVIRHRNHLAIRSANPVALNSSTATLYDFSSGLGQAYDSTGIVNDAMQNIGGTYVMWGGNGNSNNTTRASGLAAQNDYIYLFNITLGGNAGLILSNVYHGADMNLDGAVRASGLAAQNDYILLFNVILAGNAGTILTAHL